MITYGAIAHSRAAACIFRLRAAAGSLINLCENIVVVFNLEQSQVIGTNFGQNLNKLLTAYVAYRLLRASQTSLLAPSIALWACLLQA